MAERYAKGRMLQQSEAKDKEVRSLLDILPSHCDAGWAIVLLHRVYARLDVQGCVIFEPSWLKSECFLGYPFTEDQVALWADALIKAGLLKEYVVDGIRYAWTPSFYANQAGLRLDYEDPRYPRPDEWDFDELWPSDRPGIKPTPPAWAKSKKRRSRSARPATEEETPPPIQPVGGVFVSPGPASIERAIARIESELGDVVVEQLRRYALQFTEPEERAERRISALTYHAVIATIAMWKQEGGITYRGQRVAWDDARFAAAFKHVSEMVVEGKMKGHKYVEELLVDPAFPPKAGEKPVNAPDTSTKPAEAASAAARLSARELRAQRQQQTSAVQQWEADVDAWLAAHPDRERALSEQAERELGAVLARLKGSVRTKTVRAKLRELAAAEANLPRPVS